jgi:predicted enzyme related to lactoylglutathione lyase
MNISSPSPGRLGAVGQIAITVKSLESGRDFYRDILGLPLLFEVPNMAFFDGGDVRIMMAEADSEELDHPPSILYYRVMDIEATVTALKSKGVDFEHGGRLVHPAKDHDLWLAFCRDMDNNLLALMEEKPKP